MEEKDSLAVYYGKNFWTAPQGAPAQAVPVDWQFTWAGHLCRIPALYVSDAGLTLDVLLFLDSGAVRTFCKKYAGVDGERLTPLEERMLEGERPIPEASFSPRLINGLPVEPCAPLTLPCACRATAMCATVCTPPGPAGCRPL